MTTDNEIDKALDKILDRTQRIKKALNFIRYGDKKTALDDEALADIFNHNQAIMTFSDELKTALKDRAGQAVDVEGLKKAIQKHYYPEHQYRGSCCLTIDQCFGYLLENGYLTPPNGWRDG